MVDRGECAEHSGGKPLAGFVEQRSCIQFLGLPALLGEVVDEMDETAAAQIAEIMNSLTLVDMISGCATSWTVL